MPLKRIQMQLVNQVGWAVVINALLMPIALADADDVFNLKLGTSYMHDSNLFRLPSGVQPAGDNAQRSDNIWRTNAGFTINKHYSLQTFKIDYTHVESKYDNAKYLDFNANNYKAAWLWSITPYLTGNLSTSRYEDLVGFQDFRNTNVQNIRVAKSQDFSADWSPHGNWHILGGLSKLDVTNTQPFLPETSFKMDIAEGGVKYVFPSYTYLQYKVSKRNGENQETNFFNRVGKDFTETQDELSLYVPITGKSKINANAGKLSRKDSDFSDRDFSGYFGGVVYVWSPTGKLNLNFNLSRKLNAFLLDDTSYSVLDSFTISPIWAATSKIAVRANFQVSKRTFKGTGPNLIPNPNGEGLGRVDDQIGYGLGLDWTPRKTMVFGVSYQHTERNSNSDARDYTDNSATVSGQLTF